MTNTFIQTLSQLVKAGCINIPFYLLLLLLLLLLFLPNPLRCFKCQKYGHDQNARGDKLTCTPCGQFNHDSKTKNRRRPIKQNTPFYLITKVGENGSTGKSLKEPDLF